MKPPGVPSGVTAERVREVVDFREADFGVVAFREADFRVAGFRLGDFLVLAALVALDFLVAAAFFAAVTRLVALAFLVRAAFFAAVERLLAVFLDDFFAGAMIASFSRGDLSPLVIAFRTIVKLADRSLMHIVIVERDVMTTIPTSKAAVPADTT